MEKAVADLCQEGVSVLKLLVERLHVCGASLVRQRSWRVTPVDHPERCRLKSSMVGGVVAIFGPWEPPKPTLRSVAGETAQVDAQNPISDLGLAVRLGVEGCAHAESNVG
jgi:hypothetical protein